MNRSDELVGDALPVLPLTGRAVEQFDPARYRLNDATLDFTIEHARRIKDWPALEAAVDVKIEEQRRFIAWRDANIRGVGQPQKNADGTVGKLSSKLITEVSGITEKQAERMAAKLAEPEKYREHLLGAEFCAAFLQPFGNVRGTQGTGENEWFTPAEYIKLAREVLGGIDLDPATHAQAQALSRADRFFTKEDDGLQHEWCGRVWLNPPYAQPLIAQFVAKLCNEWRAGRVSAAVMLTHSYTSSSWFHEALNTASALCFTQGRVKFHDPDGTIAEPTQGQAFFYFGSEVFLFAEVFRSIGFVVPARF